MIHALKPLPSTFKETVFKIADNLKKKKNVIFSTDSYHQSSVRSQERLWRGESPKMIINVNTKMPQSFPDFLRNADNQIQLFKLMLHVLSSKEAQDMLKEKKFIMILEGKAVQLPSTEIESL